MQSRPSTLVSPSHTNTTKRVTLTRDPGVDLFGDSVDDARSVRVDALRLQPVPEFVAVLHGVHLGKTRETPQTTKIRRIFITFGTPTAKKNLVLAGTALLKRPGLCRSRHDDNYTYLMFGFVRSPECQILSDELVRVGDFVVSLSVRQDLRPSCCDAGHLRR